MIVFWNGQTVGHPIGRGLNWGAVRMKKFLPFLALLLLAGCMTPRVRTPAGHATSPATPAALINPVTPVATLEVHRASALEFFTGYEARCQIQSIDGAGVGNNYQLLPGNHTLTISLVHLGREYIGDVDLVIPEAKNYALKAKRKGDAFLLSIVDVAADEVIATSIAPLNDRMKFLVFVVQK